MTDQVQIALAWILIVLFGVLALGALVGRFLRRAGRDFPKLERDRSAP